MSDIEDKQRIYNLMAEVLASVNRVPTTVDQHSRELHAIVAAWAKAFYDFGPMVDGKHNYLISQQNIHAAEIESRIDSFLASIDTKMDRFLTTITDHIIAIRTATALAANDAGDAKTAADGAKTAATAARAAQESAGHQLLDEHGNPIHGGPRQPQEQDTPASILGVLKELLRGLPWPAKFLLALIVLVSAILSGLGAEAKWKLLGGATTAPAPSETRPHISVPQLELPKGTP